MTVTVKHFKMESHPHIYQLFLPQAIETLLQTKKERKCYPGVNNHYFDNMSQENGEFVPYWQHIIPKVKKPSSSIQKQNRHDASLSGNDSSSSSLLKNYFIQRGEVRGA